MTSGFLHPGDPVLFMKVGMHAQEDLSSIISRKQKEIADAGYAMWGYGGNTCYPNAVRTFAEAATASGRVVRLCMERINSNHAREQIRAAQFSVDDSSWHDIPSAIDVLGSRFALCIDQLEQLDFEEELPLDATEVAVGRSKGRVGSEYIRGRVDKACLTVVGDASEPKQIKKISLVANVIEPYAVFLR